MATNSGKPTDFSAADSALGYLYQVRLALLSALQRLAEDDTFALYLETLDDVVFDTTGSALELLQLKHRCDRAANLTDASPDLWKSLRVWMDGRAHVTIPMDARLAVSAVGEQEPTSALGANHLVLVFRRAAVARLQLSRNRPSSAQQSCENTAPLSGLNTYPRHLGYHSA